MISNSQNLRIDQIRRHVTIFDVLERMGYTYEEATQQIKCPFHEDHSPSARVYAEQNKVYCFTEQRSWDVIDAVQTWRQLPTIDDACSWLEQEFNVPGATQSLQGTIRAQLTRTATPSVQSSIDLVEQRLRASRAALGFERYTRLLMALDVSVYELQEKRLTAAQFGERLTRLLGATRVA